MRAKSASAVRRHSHKPERFSLSLKNSVVEIHVIGLCEQAADDVCCHLASADAAHRCSQSRRRHLEILALVATKYDGSKTPRPGRSQATSPYIFDARPTAA